MTPEVAAQEFLQKEILVERDCSHWRGGIGVEFGSRRVRIEGEPCLLGAQCLPRRRVGQKGGRETTTAGGKKTRYFLGVIRQDGGVHMGQDRHQANEVKRVVRERKANVGGVA